MAQGLTYASGTFEMRNGIPASAFSRGDLLCLTSASSLSRLPHPLAAATDIVGVATADSTKSVDNQVSYLVPGFDTIFWSACTPGSTYTRGADVNFNVDAAGRPVANGSTGTVRAVVERGVAEVGNQSIESRIQVRVITNGGNTVFA